MRERRGPGPPRGCFHRCATRRPRVELSLLTGAAPRGPAGGLLHTPSDNTARRHGNGATTCGHTWPARVCGSSGGRGPSRALCALAWPFFYSRLAHERAAPRAARSIGEGRRADARRATPPGRPPLPATPPPFFYHKRHLSGARVLTLEAVSKRQSCGNLVVFGQVRTRPGDPRSAIEPRHRPDGRVNLVRTSFPRDSVYSAAVAVYTVRSPRALRGLGRYPSRLPEELTAPLTARREQGTETGFPWVVCVATKEGDQ